MPLVRRAIKSAVFVLSALLWIEAPGRADRVDELTRALRAQDVAVRADAAEALAHLHSRRAVPALLAALGDPVASVRGQALRALASTLGRADTPCF